MRKRREGWGAHPRRLVLFAGCRELLYGTVVLCWQRSESTEESVLLAVQASGEIECSGRTCAGVIAEGEGPQAVDGHQGIVGILQEAEELVIEAVEGGNPATAEVAHEDGIAEDAEVARRPDHSPRGIQPIAVLQVADVFAGGGEDFHVAVAVAGRI